MGDWKRELRGIKGSLAKSDPSRQARKDVGEGRGKKLNHVEIGKLPVRSKKMAEQGHVSAKGVNPIRQGSFVNTNAIKGPAVSGQLGSVSQLVNVKLPVPAPVVSGVIQAVEPAKLGASPVPKVLRFPKQRELYRQRQYRPPEEWVEKGTQTQFSSKTGRPLDVVIGLDFGTSYTKAAVGMMDQIYPVTWTGVSAYPEAYLLPTEYTLFPDGRAVLGQHPIATVEQIHTALKQPFINGDVSLALVADASVFVALVLRYVRAWVFKFHGEKLGTAQIRWMLNIGAPSDGLEFASRGLAYKRLGYSAWDLSVRGGDESLNDAISVAGAWKRGQSPHELTDLQVVPEFIAQMSGYVQSPQRVDGLHSLVDIGGGTMDVVTFNVFRRDGEDTFPFLVPEVKVLGTQMLDQNRLEGILQMDVMHVLDGLQPVLAASAYAELVGIPEEHVKARDELFFVSVQDVVTRVYAKTKHHRYRLSDAWGKGVRVFFTGGGAQVDGYAEAIRSGGQKIARSVNLLPLPLHPKLADFSGTPGAYQRVSVACGLAQDAFSLGRIVAAKDVDDDRPVVTKRKERPDRDELYSR